MKPDERLTQRELTKDITGVLHPIGFRRRGHSWGRTLPETKQVVTLQKSRWGEQYYVNLGVLIRQLEEVAFPAPHACHLIMRLSMLMSEADLDRSHLDLASPAARLQWERTLTTLALQGCAVLENCRDVKGLANYVRRHGCAAGVVTGEARTFLNQRAREVTRERRRNRTGSAMKR